MHPARDQTHTHTNLVQKPSSTLYKKVHNPSISSTKKGAKSSSSIYEKVQRGQFPLSSEIGAATVCVPGDQQPDTMIKRARTHTHTHVKVLDYLAIKYLNSPKYHISV